MFIKASTFLLFLISLVLTNGQDTCAGGEFDCEDRRGNPGVQISQTRSDESCKTKCVEAEKAQRQLDLGKASCGAECEVSPTSIASSCEDTEACPESPKSFQIKFDKGGKCVTRCTKEGRAARKILNDGATCGRCEVSPTSIASNEDGICAGEEFACVGRRGKPGVEISMLKGDGSCKTSCLGAKRAGRAKRKLDLGKANCGAECEVSPTSIADSCEDNEACPESPKSFQINFLKDGTCRTKCTKEKQAARKILRNDARCGPCVNPFLDP